MSSLGTLNPFWFVSLLLNTLFCGVIKYKYFANQYLRNSGLNYIIVRPAGLVDNYDKLSENVKNNKIISISQCYNPLIKPKLPTKDGKKEKGSNTILRSDCAIILTDLALNTGINNNLNKCTFNLWCGSNESMNINNGNILNYNILHNDNKNDLNRFKGINHDRPYWIAMSVIGVSLAALTRFAFPKQTNKLIGYFKRT